MKIQDILLFDDQLTDEELIIQKSARDYCQKELLPRITDANRNEIFDKGIYKEMAEMGFLGAPINGYGCAGTNYVSYGLIAREIERVDSSYRSAYSVQTSLAMHAIYHFGSDEQKEKYLQKLASGNLIGCFGLTEANAGSDPSSMSTKAEKVSGGYRISGEKSWISNSPIADVFIIWAKSNEHNGKIKGFILEKNTPGLSAPIIDGKLSLKVSITGKIVMDNVFVSEESILPNVEASNIPALSLAALLSLCTASCIFSFPFG